MQKYRMCRILFIFFIVAGLAWGVNNSTNNLDLASRMVEAKTAVCPQQQRYGGPPCATVHTAAARLHIPQHAPPLLADTAATELQKQGATFAAPGQQITYTIRLDNLTAVTHTFQLTDTLPSGVAYVPGSATGGMVYDAGKRLLTWQGAVGPGAEGYSVTAAAADAYVNLGALSTPPPNLCAGLSDCDEATAVFDLGDERVTLFGETIDALHVSSNGLILGPNGLNGLGCVACPQRLPQAAWPNQLIAGLWRDVDMNGGHGAWYGAIVTGLLANPDDAVFYANWHDAAHFGNPFLTTRHGMAVVLDGQSEPAGRVYVFVDAVSDAAALAAVGYAVGMEDANGRIGVTAAYAPCSDAPCIMRPSLGNVPAPQTTFRFDPAIVPGDNGRTFAYAVTVTAAVGTVLVNEATTMREEDNIRQTAVWETLVTYRTHLPVIRKE